VVEREVRTDRQRQRAAVPPETAVTFKGLAPGVYGVKTYQDTNRNGKFDQNWLGWPLERYGFSKRRARRGFPSQVSAGPSSRCRTAKTPS